MYVETLEMALSEEQESRIIEMAWEDRTPFEAIERLFGLPEKEVIKLMRKNLKQKTSKFTLCATNTASSVKLAI